MIMKRFRWVLIGMTAGIVLTLIFLWTGSLESALAERGQQAAVGTPTPLSDEGAPGALIQAAGSSDEIPPASFIQSIQAPALLATPIPGETLVYFIPSDSDGTGTVLFLYNTDVVSHTVALRGYSYNAVLGYSLNIVVGAGSFVRLSSDSIAAAPPPSWATPAPIITNFTDFTYLASLSLPKGVKVEGYTVFNPGTGTVDPRIDQGAIPLRFSTDPSTLFLPAVSTGP
jgi:hypothetical protein